MKQEKANVLEVMKIICNSLIMLVALIYGFKQVKHLEANQTNTKQTLIRVSSVGCVLLNNWLLVEESLNIDGITVKFAWQVLC